MKQSENGVIPKQSANILYILGGYSRWNKIDMKGMLTMHRKCGNREREITLKIFFFANNFKNWKMLFANCKVQQFPMDAIKCYK